MFAFLPITAMATLPVGAPQTLAGSAYDTDITNSYVQDQVTSDLVLINGFLCMINAMSPSQLVNTGDYIALVDGMACFASGGSGGQSSDKNKNPSYIPMQVNSSRTSNSTPMNIKVWLDVEKYALNLFASASQAPSKYAPYGVFRLDGCFKDTTVTTDTCTDNVGYIDASRSGVAFYLFMKQNSGSNIGSFNELSVQLAATSSTNTGSGILVNNKWDANAATLTTDATTFAYTENYFYRKDKTAAVCFDRNLNFAEESAWSYALYNATTGAVLDHPMGYPIEYVYDSANTSGTGVNGTTYSGYVSYWGLSMQYGSSTQIIVPNGATVSKISYSTSPPTKTPYTLLQTGGKLIKHSSTSKLMSTIDKMPFNFYAYNNVVTAGAVTILSAGTTYELYWDNTSLTFVVTGKQNTSGNMEYYPITVASSTIPAPGPVTALEMYTANPYSFGSWSDLLGGWFNVYPSGSTYSASSKVILQTENVVYPSEFAALNSAGGLKCISNCPDSTAGNPTLLNLNGGPYAIGNIQSYSLNSVTGNLHVGAPSGSTSTGNPVYKNTTGTLYSGQLISATDFATIQGLKVGCPSCSYYSSDLSLLSNPSYYTWQTSSDTWDQMAFLKDPTSGSIVAFYPPLPINFVVPSKASYGNLQGKTVALQYGDYGSLWGIPNKCTDATTNKSCIFSPDTSTTPTTPATLSSNMHWAPTFSIPYNVTEGFVTVGTVGTTQGTIQTGDKFLVKALEKEIRFRKTDQLICDTLFASSISVPSLPSYSKWINPTTSVGTKTPLDPATTAPRVIQGVKQY